MDFRCKLRADTRDQPPSGQRPGVTQGSQAMFLIILVIVVIIAAALMLRRRYH
jgi:hypothetical protein